MRSLYALSTLLLGGTLFAAAGCGSKTTWTPDSVMPPASLENALREADAAVEMGRARFDDEPSTYTLTRDGAILTVLARNRSLAVSRYGPDIAATLPGEARAAFDPTLMATVSHGRDRRQISGTSNFAIADGTAGLRETKTTQGDVTVSNYFPTGTELFLTGGTTRTETLTSPDPEYASDASVGINQRLLRGFGPSVNLVSLRQARNDAARSIHELRGVVLDLVQQSEQAYWGLVLAKETLKIREFSVELAEEQVRLNRNLVEAGRAVRANLTAAEAEYASRLADLADARAEVRRRTIELVRLMDPDATNQWESTFVTADAPEVTEVFLNPLQSGELAKLYSPELAQARLDLANRELETVRTRNGLLPRLDAFASYGHSFIGNNWSDSVNGLDEDDYNNYNVGLDFEMQPFNRAERARNRRARFQRLQAEAAIANLEQLLEANVRNAIIEIERQRERLIASGTAVTSREEQLRSERERYTTGLSTNLDVLQVQRDLIQSQVDEVTARVNYILSLTSLYRTEGTLLDRRGVSADTSLE